jgi:hypothetical protein
MCSHDYSARVGKSPRTTGIEAYHCLMGERDLIDRGYEAGGIEGVVLFSLHVSIAVALEHLVRIWIAFLALYVDEALLVY